MKKILVCAICGYVIDKEQDSWGGSNYICRGECKDLIVPLEKEVRSDEKPECFSYHDNRDHSCRRCGLKSKCAVEFELTRPECFGLNYGQHEECEACIDASQCTQKQGDSNMATSRKSVRRTRRSRQGQSRVAPKPVPDAVVEEELDLEEEELDLEGELESADDSADFTEWSVPDLRAELEELGLDVKGRKSVLVKRLMAAHQDDVDDEDVDDEDYDDEQEYVSPTVTRTPVKAAKPEAKVDVAEPVASEVDVVGRGMPTDHVALALINLLENGQVITLRAITNGYTISLGGVQPAGRPVVQPAGRPQAVTKATVKAATDVAVADGAKSGPGLKGKAYEEEVCTPEYYGFYYTDAGGGKPWTQMSVEEKAEYADELDVVWEEQDDVRVNAIRMTKAIFDKLEIAKYKPEYSTTAARNAVKA